MLGIYLATQFIYGSFPNKMLFNSGTTENNYGGNNIKDNENFNESEYDYLMKEGENPPNQVCRVDWSTRGNLFP